MSRSQREKGIRRELEIVHLHAELGIKAERVPLSGAARYKGGGHDVDCYLDGQEAAPWCCEVKGRANGAGWVVIASWVAVPAVMMIVPIIIIFLALLQPPERMRTFQYQHGMNRIEIGRVVVRES